MRHYFSAKFCFMTNRTCALFIAILLFSGGASAQLDTLVFKAFLDKVYTDFELPSMAVSIVKDGKTVLTYAKGIRSENDQQGPDANTLYGIASLSKAFTAASIGMLVDDGLLKWNDPVVKHLPNFKLHDPSVTQHFTVEDLLSHRSGLITFDGDLLWYGTNYTRTEVMERIQYRPLTHEFRNEFGYQNIMFISAGELIEKVSGMTWDAFVKTRILDPLKMNRTTSNFDTFYKDENIAKPFINGKEIFMLSYDNSGATAALNSSAGDMSKWMNFWLANGLVDGDTLLSSKAIHEIWSMHTNLNTSGFDDANGTNFKGYGLGWFLMDYNGKKIAHHGGGLPGYITKVALSPKDDFGIVILTNDMSSASSMLMYAALDWLEGKEIEAWSEKFLGFKKGGETREIEEKAKRLKTKKTNPKVLASSKYVGTYRDEMYGNAEVLIENGQLVLSMIPSKELFTGLLTPWDDNAFKFDHNDPFLTYGVVTFNAENGLVNGFKIDLPNYDFHFDKLDFKKIAQ